MWKIDARGIAGGLVGIEDECIARVDAGFLFGEDADHLQERAVGLVHIDGGVVHLGFELFRNEVNLARPGGGASSAKGVSDLYEINFAGLQTKLASQRAPGA
jgi:hypothetical protein